MTPQQEAAFEAKAEKHFKSHREMPTGRSFTWDHVETKESIDNYRSNFDKTFPNAPGAEFK